MSTRDEQEAAMVEEIGKLMLALAGAWIVEEKGWDRDLAKLHLLVGIERFASMSEELKMELAMRCAEHA